MHRAMRLISSLVFIRTAPFGSTIAVSGASVSLDICCIGWPNTFLASPKSFAGHQRIRQEEECIVSCRVAGSAHLSLRALFPSAIAHNSIWYGLFVAIDEFAGDTARGRSPLVDLVRNGHH